MIILLPDNKRKKEKRKWRKEKQKGTISELSLEKLELRYVCFRRGYVAYIKAPLEGGMGQETAIS